MAREGRRGDPKDDSKAEDQLTVSGGSASNEQAEEAKKVLSESEEKSKSEPKPEPVVRTPEDSDDEVVNAARLAAGGGATEETHADPGVISSIMGRLKKGGFK